MGNLTYKNSLQVTTKDRLRFHYEEVSVKINERKINDGKTAAGPTGLLCNDDVTCHVPCAWTIVSP